ncbi:MAG: polyribonucleotide nucleotidyltransferase, partial [Oscillospiraceae bacterium]|nr:polyribonucleotide nucleotidyltransferase [Oscillospiraceae bacterium]
MFENYRVFKTELAGKPISFEVGKMCGLSNGSCMVRYGETSVLCNVTASQKPRDGIDFFPLSVDFEEKLYAVGKIPGSFLKREGRPTEKAILASRMVDRPIRPLFPKDMRNDVSVVMTVMSVDPDCQPEVAGMIGTSFAIAISDIPWNGPVAGVNVGLVDGEIVICPDEKQREKSDMVVTVVSSAEKIVMIEAGANEVDDDTMLEAILKAHEENQKMVSFIAEVQKEIGKEKFTFESQEVDHDLFEAVKEFAIDRIKYALDTDDKVEREARLAPIVADIHEKFEESHPELAYQLDEIIYKLQKFIVRRWLLDEGKRVDGRQLNEMRPLAAEVGLLPRVHGSGMFTRGQTQVLTIATLGSMREAQLLDGIDNEETRRYMHHYIQRKVLILFPAHGLQFLEITTSTCMRTGRDCVIFRH